MADENEGTNLLSDSISLDEENVEIIGKDENTNDTSEEQGSENTETSSSETNPSNKLIIAARVSQGINAMKKKTKKPTSVHQAELILGNRCDKAKEAEEMIMKEVTSERRKTYDGAKDFLIFLFSDVGLMVLCLAYAVVGARVFMAFELPNEELNKEAKKQAALDVLDRMNYMSEVTWQWHNLKNPMNRSEFQYRVERDSRLLIKFMVENAADKNYDGEVETWDYDWTFPNTLLFTITIMTTVGYGHISPKTFNGQIFCIFYSLIGLPLFMFLLANIGNPMAGGLKYSYSRICCRFCRAKRRRSEFPNASLKGRQIIDDIVGEEYYMPTDFVIIPIILCLLIIVSFLLIGTFLFSEWEQWDLVSAAYFSFITLSTIGFGDYVPSESFVVDSSNPITFVKMTIAVSYTVIGMALLSMVISLIQEGVTLKAEAMGKKMGFGKAAKVMMDEVSIQRRRREQNGYFIMDEENQVETIEDNVDERNDDETFAPENTTSSVISIKDSIPGAVEHNESTEDAPAEEEIVDDFLKEEPENDIVDEELENLSDMD